ncbi:proton-conducting transporter membrane subunit [Deinococcus pimensis]|uniref:proton-conducting transporter transmembrane domain-containing protein n=1 Tax=Deinococcus pimensis TaxID=309888 RepID=UPI0004B1B985|nr:proton-conducting transporter membrane subunit [Deinococcus pimensis]
MNAVVLPVVVPLAAAILLLFVRHASVRWWLSLGASLLTLAVSALLLPATLRGEVLVSALGDWPAPWGIQIVADALSAVTLTASAITAVLAVTLSRPTVDSRRERFGHHALLQFLFTGVNLSFLTGDLFNLFVAFEVTLVASYALVTLGGAVGQLREGFRYVVFNLLVSALFVVGAGLSYGLLGTLNFAHLAERVAALGPTPAVTALALLLMTVFATKTALFPLAFWLPGSYPEPPPATGAFFAAVLTKVGAYALIRVFSTVFTSEPDVTGPALMALGGLTVLVGALGALSQRTWRAILSFTVVGSVGFLAFGLGLGSEAGLAATVFYLLSSVVVTFTLFAVAAWAERASLQEETRVGGALEVAPWLAGGFMAGLLGMVGLPPTSGFVGKFGLVLAGAREGGWLAWLGVAAMLVSSLVTLVALVTVWRRFFWGEVCLPRRPGVPPSLTVTVAAAVALTVLLAAFSGPVYRAASVTAAQLATPDVYVRGVLRGGETP